MPRSTSSSPPAAAPAASAPLPAATIAHNASVVRAFALVSHLAETNHALSLTELAAALSLSRSTAFKLLQTLVASGMVAYDARRQRYRPGADLYRLASLVLQNGSFVEIARVAMRELTARMDESTCLNLLDPSRDAFTVAAVEESSSPLQYVIELGQWHPLHAGASGKAILAFAAPEIVERVLRSRLLPVTPDTVQDPGELTRQLAAIRTRGYDVSHGERLAGAVGIAAPILDASGCSVASVQVTIPQHRFDKRRLPLIARLVMQAAERIGTAASALARGR